jgi:glycolate oxidase
LTVDFVCNQEIVMAARKSLAQDAWDYIAGAAESETTLRRNRVALDSVAFEPRVLRDVSVVHPSGEFLGHKLRIPVVLAPIGSMQAIAKGGSADACRGAGAFGTIPFISSITEPPLEECAAATDSPKMFQLYVRGDLDWIKALLDRVQQAGFSALAVTVDSAYYGIRERQLMSHWLPPSVRMHTGRRLQSAITWDLIDELKKIWDGPLALKGIATVADAKLALEHDVDAIWISNHGGRQLDHGRGTMEMLPGIAEAVGGRVPIVIDGGFLRGSDVVKALALGASAAAIGRLQCWALAAAGPDGLVRALEILETEMINTMGLLGVTSVAELDASYVCESTPVGPCHEMSTFVHLPNGRIL